jgi:cytochrome P450
MSEIGTKRCPVQFDQHGAEHASTWVERFRELREQCPRAWTDNFGGFWIATKYKDIVNIAQRRDAFTSFKSLDRETGEEHGGITIPTIVGERLAPAETEGAEWEGVRGLLNRRFAPPAVEARREKVRHFAAALIDRVIETGRMDIVDDLTNPLPALVTMEVFGFPQDEWKIFADAFHKISYTASNSPEYPDVVKGMQQFHQRVDEEIEVRRKAPSDDLLTLLAVGTIDGEPLDYHKVHEIAFNVLAGGVDTTTALTSHALLYLGRHPDERQRLIDDPALVRLACEEFVRFTTPIHALARNAKIDVDIDGWEFRAGERVLLAFASGNRDPEAFDDPDTVKMDRFPNKHFGFGIGQHRCIGSFLARLQFETLITEVLNRIPDYKIIEEEIAPYPSIGITNGWIHIPATFTPGRKVGANL